VKIYVEIYNVHLIGVLKKRYIFENVRNGKFHSKFELFENMSECEYCGMKVTDKHCIYSEMKTNVGSLLLRLLRSDSFDFAYSIEGP